MLKQTRVLLDAYGRLKDMGRRIFETVCMVKFIWVSKLKRPAATFHRIDDIMSKTDVFRIKYDFSRSEQNKGIGFFMLQNLARLQHNEFP